MSMKSQLIIQITLVLTVMVYIKLLCSLYFVVYFHSSRTYDTTFCMGKAESIWYKVLNDIDEKQKKILDSCGSKLKKDFVDITYFILIYCILLSSTLNCNVDGADPFASFRSLLNTNLYSCIRFSMMYKNKLILR